MKNKNEDIAIVSDKNIMALSKFLYDKKYTLEYKRPTNEEEREFLKELQLTNSF